jgi:hypothetical protein
MNSPQKKPASASPPPWQPRFGLGAMFMVMLICCVAAAAASYLVLGERSRSYWAVFVVFAMAAPAILVVAVSIGRMILVWLDRPNNRR